MKLFKIFEIVYIAVFVLSSIEVYNQWNVDRNRAYLFLVFAVVSVFMFFFRRHYRKKFEQRQNKN